jgi:hypothetical protein
VVDLRWDQIKFKAAALHVRRLKNGTPTSLNQSGAAVTAPPSAGERETPLVFVSERGAPLSAPSRIVEQAAVAAKLGIKADDHVLRHACGYKLANDG